jgi:hypothetical protein
LQIFESFIALRLRVEENDMNEPVSLVASTRSSAVARSRPVISRRWRARRARSRGGS